MPCPVGTARSGVRQVLVLYGSGRRVRSVKAQGRLPLRASHPGDRWRAAQPIRAGRAIHRRDADKRRPDPGSDGPARTPRSAASRGQTGAAPPNEFDSRNPARPKLMHAALGRSGPGRANPTQWRTTGRSPGEQRDGGEPEGPDSGLQGGDAGEVLAIR